MTLFGLILRGLWFHRRRHLGVLLGAATACAVLTGALLVGDCVRYTLRRFALLRLGHTEFALYNPNRLATDALASRLEKAVDAPVCPVLQLSAVAIREADDARRRTQVNRARVLGVDERFWALASGEPPPGLGAGEAAVGRHLAEALRAGVGDEIALRIQQPGLLPQDAPLAEQRDRTRRATFRIARVVPDEQLGRFSLEASQIPPLNAFVPLRRLQTLAESDGKANTLLVGAPQVAPLNAENLGVAMHKVWRLEDMGLRVREYEGRVLQLESDRVFFDPAAAEAVLRPPPGSEAGPARAPVGALTYLVNTIRSESGRVTPYSFITALSPSDGPARGPVPAGMQDDEIVVSRWLATELALATGRTVTVSYFALTPANTFQERSCRLRVRGIVEMESLAGEKALMPRFPGLTGVERCADWSIGLPMDEKLLADRGNETYWRTYGDTPKAFVTLSAGQTLWANRFGNLSGVRYAREGWTSDSVAAAVRERLDPAAAGLTFQPVRDRALGAANAAVDFGQLFGGMSLFLVVSAALLTAMLFALAVESRTAEMGMLLAAGFTPARVRAMAVAEATGVALLGSLAGVAPGMLYTRGLVWGLQSYWRGAVANAAIVYHAEATTLAAGFAAGVVVAVGAVALASWRLARRAPAELLRGGRTDLPVALATPRSIAAPTLSLFAGVAAIALVATGAGRPQNPAPAFFMAGALLLIAGVSAAACRLRRAAEPGVAHLTLVRLGMVGAARRRGRSLAAVAVLACGSFVVLSVSCMQDSADRSAGGQAPGCGGFDLIGEATLPLVARLDTEADWAKAFPRTGPPHERLAILTAKVHDAEEASCLNLNRVETPRLLGVDAQAFERAGAFVSQDEDSRSSAASAKDPWALLSRPLADGCIPGLAGDLNTAMWSLRKKVGPVTGDTLLYADERGQPFRVRLVGALPVPVSILQGSVLIPDWAFTARFPSEAGYRLWLVKTPAGTTERWREELATRFEREGLDLTPAGERLNAYLGVESTYLRMFLVLGGLGLMLGAIGLGIVLVSNVNERRSELAMLQAVGYSRRTLRLLVAGEHGILLAAGLLIGLASAVAASWPQIAARSAMPWREMAAVAGGIAAAGILSTLIAVRLVLRAPLLPALRNE